MVPMTPFNVGVSINKLEAPDLNVENISKSFMHLTDVLSGDFNRNKELERQTKEAQLLQLELANNKATADAKLAEENRGILKIQQLMLGGMDENSAREWGFNNGISQSNIDLGIAQASFKNREAEYAANISKAQLEAILNSSKTPQPTTSNEGNQVKAALNPSQNGITPTTNATVSSTSSQSTPTADDPTNQLLEAMQVHSSNYDKVNLRKSDKDGDDNFLYVDDTNGVLYWDKANNYSDVFAHNSGLKMIPDQATYEQYKRMGYTDANETYYSKDIGGSSKQVGYAHVKAQANAVSSAINAGAKANGGVSKHTENVKTKVNTLSDQLKKDATATNFNPHSTSYNTALASTAGLHLFNSTVTSDGKVVPVNSGIDEVLSNPNVIKWIVNDVDPKLKDMLSNVKSLDDDTIKKIYADLRPELEHSLLGVLNVDPKDPQATQAVTGHLKYIIASQLAANQAIKNNRLNVTNRDQMIGYASSTEFLTKELQPIADVIFNINAEASLPNDFSKLVKASIGGIVNNSETQGVYEGEILRSIFNSDKLPPNVYNVASKRNAELIYNNGKELLESLNISKDKSLDQQQTSKELKEYQAYKQAMISNASNPMGAASYAEKLAKKDAEIRKRYNLSKSEDIEKFLMDRDNLTHLILTGKKKSEELGAYDSVLDFLGLYSPKL